MSKNRSNQILGLLLIIVCMLITSSAYLIIKELSLVNVIITTSLILLSFLLFMTGYKLVRYEAIHQITMNEIRRRANKYPESERIVARPVAIIFCGIDGSGKTTQIRFIAKRLKEKGLRFKYVWLRSASYLSLLFSVFYRLLTHITKNTEHEKKVIAKIRNYLLTIDMFIRSMLRVRIPIRMGYYILCDRFVPDTIVDMISEMENAHLFRSVLGRLLLALIPKQSIIVLLDVEESEAYRRKKDIPSLNYLRKRRRLYLALAHILKIPIIDGRKEPNKVHDEIVRKILSHYPFWYIGIKANKLPVPYDPSFKV